MHLYPIQKGCWKSISCLVKLRGGFIRFTQEPNGTYVRLGCRAAWPRRCSPPSPEWCCQRKGRPTPPAGPGAETPGRRADAPTGCRRDARGGSVHAQRSVWHILKFGWRYWHAIDLGRDLQPVEVHVQLDVVLLHQLVLDAVDFGHNGDGRPGVLGPREWNAR